MKELLNNISETFTLLGYLFFIALFGCISTIAYYFYPTATTIILILFATGWIMEFVKRRKDAKQH